MSRTWTGSGRYPPSPSGSPARRQGLAGAIERDKIAAGHDDLTMDLLRERLRSGQSVLAAAFGPDGPLAAGSCQPMGGVAEITGVGVLPSSRRMGLGGAVTAALAREALRRGVQTVFLAASDDDVARVYARLGFAADRHRHDRRTRRLGPRPPR